MAVSGERKSCVTVCMMFCLLFISSSFSRTDRRRLSISSSRCFLSLVRRRMSLWTTTYSSTAHRTPAADMPHISTNAVSLSSATRMCLSSMRSVSSCPISRISLERFRFSMLLRIFSESDRWENACSCSASAVRISSSNRRISAMCRVLGVVLTRVVVRAGSSFFFLRNRPNSPPRFFSSSGSVRSVTVVVRTDAVCSSPGRWRSSRLSMRNAVVGISTIRPISLRFSCSSLTTVSILAVCAGSP